MKISGLQYTMMYGPTVGDKVRLADTNLVIEVEKDYTVYGDECKFGGGKTLRDGMGQSVNYLSGNGELDLVITNALVWTTPASSRLISVSKMATSQVSVKLVTQISWMA